MKRRELDRVLTQMAKSHGVVLIREAGSRHDKFRVATSFVIVPRHKEINELTARAIIAHLDDILRALGEEKPDGQS